MGHRISRRALRIRDGWTPSPFLTIPGVISQPTYTPIFGTIITLGGKGKVNISQIDHVFGVRCSLHKKNIILLFSHQNGPQRNRLSSVINQNVSIPPLVALRIGCVYPGRDRVDGVLVCSNETQRISRLSGRVLGGLEAKSVYHPKEWQNKRHPNEHTSRRFFSFFFLLLFVFLHACHRHGQHWQSDTR